MTQLQQREGDGFVDIAGESYYRIASVDRMEPFLMSVLSDADHWMFVSSTGGLTAGRWDANCALFPYETDDRLQHASGVTGPVTVVHVGEAIWEPFAGRRAAGVRRNLYKSVVGNQVVFEEIHEPLGLAFSYRWSNSAQFGFVRTASVVNLGSDVIQIELLDGLLNVLPYGLEPATYQSMSNLTRAYRRSELIDPETRLAVFSMESLISDRAEPAEALRASVVWSLGLDHPGVNLNSGAVERFRERRRPGPNALITGIPGAYLLESVVELTAGAAREWVIVADAARTQRQVAELNDRLRSPDIPGSVEESVRAGTESLLDLLAAADGVQSTGDRMAAVHHLSNVAFNIMRGGVFVSPTSVGRTEFIDFLRSRNRLVAARHQATLENLDQKVDREALLDVARGTGDDQLIRLVLGYLPLTFSRRHGDPSRPWNAFSIRVHDDSGDPVVSYEGNWRDIFQNWEALALSYPDYLAAMVSVFLSASTADGFNPYRINSDGIDWEVPEPDNPWSNIGYWGDHQIVYLQRLLALTKRFDPQALDSMLGERWFAYADVPYRIAPYQAVVADPHNTIEHDDAAAARIQARIDAVGGDGKLMTGPGGDVYLVSMLEKLVVPCLAKLSNLVPGGGIWMNTQRPEWNDANNALVGNGLSMVTVFHLRRHLDGLIAIISGSQLASVAMSSEVVEWMDQVRSVLEANSDYLKTELTDQRRRAVTDALGEAFSSYRSAIYGSGFSGTEVVEVSRFTDLLQSAIAHLDDTIGRSRRDDGLYHSYNLAHFGAEDVLAVEHLEAMLEGQVAVLSSGVLTAEERVHVLEALFESEMYRPDQISFMLYPVKDLPSFLSKNVIPADLAESIELFTRLQAAGDSSLVDFDDDGLARFGAGCSNGGAVESLLDELAADQQWTELVAQDRDAVLAAYEEVFNHHAYTGRSGSMYGYEGIGSIYWHMVSKLLVAVQESIVEARAAAADLKTIDDLVAMYWRVRSGLGFAKAAAEFGAFPMDAYSHTPGHAGAQQPGMTGQVKEEVITRLLEVGVRIDDGLFQIDPALVRSNEFVVEPTEWTFRAQTGERQVYRLEPGMFGLSFCQVPVIFELSDGSASIEVTRRDGTSHRVQGTALDRETSAELFARRGGITSMRVALPEASLGGHTTPD